MNKKIRTLNLENLLFFDAEFVRRNDNLEMDSKETNLYAHSMRDKKTGLVPPFSEVNEDYKLRAALNPTFNKAVVISVGFIKDVTLYYKSLRGTQKEIIEEFYTLLTTSGLTPCGHNILGFDLPQLRLKALECGIDMNILSENFNDSQKKPWDLTKNVADTMEISKGTYFYNLSLDALCMMLGIDTPKDDISGADVSRVFYEEEDGLERIAAYCNKDVVAVARVMCALAGKPDYIQMLVDRDSETQETKSTEKPVEIEVPNVLERIYKQNEITALDKKELLEKIGKKRLTKGNKVIVIDMLHKLSVNSKMFEADKQSIVDEKLKSVEELINSL